MLSFWIKIKITDYSPQSTRH